MKICQNCEIEYPFSEFYKHKGTNDGLSCYCKTCDKQRQADRRARLLALGKYQTVPDGVTTKVCSFCGREKHVSQFYKSKTGTWGLESRCAECSRSYQRERRESGVIDGIDRVSPARRCHLKKAYGMTVEEYLERIEKQNNLCAICHQPETAVKGSRVCNLSVDHDHDTGANRDLLCDKCNHLLGDAREDISILLAAIEYLKRHSNGGNQGDSGANERSDRHLTSSVSSGDR